MSRKVTSSADHEAVNLMVGWWQLIFTSQGRFVTIQFLAGTLRRLPFCRWDASSLEHEQDCGIRLQSLKTTWRTVCKPYLDLDLRSVVQCVLMIMIDNNETYIFRIFMHLYLYIHSLVIIRFMFMIFMQLYLHMDSGSCLTRQRACIQNYAY